MTIKMGRVTSTQVEDGTCLLSVQMDRKGVEERAVPVLTPLSGITYVPEEGDMVALDELEDGTPIATGVVSKGTFEQPDLDEQEFSFVLDEDTSFSFTKGSNGYDVEISTLGSVSVDSDDVTLGKGNEGVVVDLDVTFADGYVSSISPVYSENTSVD